MKKLFTILALCLFVFASCSDDDNNDSVLNNQITLNLNSFDLSDGVTTNVKDGKIWKGSYDPNYTNFTSDIFTFSHVVSVSQWGNYSYGFVVSNSKDNADHGESFYTINQYGSITKGGVEGEGKPFAISYISNYDANGNPYNGTYEVGETFKEQNYSSWVKIGDNNTIYKAISGYFTNTSYAYYVTLNGNSFSSAIKDGDYVTLKIYGVDADNKLTKPVDFNLADYRSKDKSEKTVLNKWEKADLSSLGNVKYLVFNIDSNIKNNVGITVPTYFCLDKLTVEKVQ